MKQLTQQRANIHKQVWQTAISYTVAPIVHKPSWNQKDENNVVSFSQTHISRPYYFEVPLCTISFILFLFLFVLWISSTIYSLFFHRNLIQLTALLLLAFIYCLPCLYLLYSVQKSICEETIIRATYYSIISTIFFYTRNTINSTFFWSLLRIYFIYFKTLYYFNRRSY